MSVSTAESIIRKTQSQIPLTNIEIQSLVNKYTAGLISDELMTVWLSSVFENGLSTEETNSYTSALLHSGHQLDFSALPGYVVDKHSTGGLGDKVSLILGPLLAACGCYVPMLVGRGLGHTGGTLDKLESIPGYQGQLSIEAFSKIVAEVGISIMGQTPEICPADGKIYALRDVTHLVASYPLICGSIMSKKIAEGIQGLVLDIKTGNGAFMDSIEKANTLGQILKSTGTSHGLDMSIAITDMNQPLGNRSGIWCEVQESIDALKGNGPNDLMTVVYHLGELALNLAEIEDPSARMKNHITNGRAYEIFEKMVHSHGGDIHSFQSNIHSPNCTHPILARSKGYISNLDTMKLGQMIVEMGGGRHQTRDNIDPSVGFNLYHKLGDFIERDEPWMTIYGNDESKIGSAKSLADNCIKISSERPKLPPLIYK